MEIARDITLIIHFLGLAMVIGPFLIHMRARAGFAFSWMLAGGIIQLVTGIALTGLAEMRLADSPDMSLDHTKIAVKLVLSSVLFVIALIAFRKQKKLVGDSQRVLLPLLHSAGALGLSNVIIAVVWPGLAS